MTDVELIDRLADLGEQLDAELVELGDGLADAVVAALGDGRSRSGAHRGAAGRRRSWLVAAAALLLVTTMVALPGPRHTIARWFGVGSIRIDPVRPPSVTPAGAERTATSAADPDPLRLGPPVGADAATAETGLPLPFAPALGEPTSYHLPGGPQIVARYEVEGRPVLVATLAGSTDEAVFSKEASREQVTAVDVHGAPGLWISGAHDFGYIGDDGEYGRERLRVAGDTLIWARPGVTLRIEGARDLEYALEIAGSMER